MSAAARLGDGTSPNGGRRVASSQAWRRLWKNVKVSELADIAEDVANYVEWATMSPIGRAQRAAITEALASYPWDVKAQQG